MRKAILVSSVVAAVFASLRADAGDESGAGEIPAPRGGEKREFSNAAPFHLGLQAPSPSGYSAGFSAGDSAGYWPGQAPVNSYLYHDGYWGTPWYIRQTRKYKHAAPVYAEPRLGLHYHYPRALQLGIQVPPEPDQPISPPTIGHDRAAAGPGAVGLGAAAHLGIARMRAGKYAEAGRLFASELKDEAASPDLYLLLAEAFVALEKFEDADVVLRQAIETAPDLSFLDRAQLKMHFPSEKVLEEKLAGLAGAGNVSVLLRGTFLLLGGRQKEGLDEVRGLVYGISPDAAARRVYMHFVGAAFEAEKPAPDAKPAGEKPAEKKPEAEKPKAKTPF